VTDTGTVSVRHGRGRRAVGLLFATGPTATGTDVAASVARLALAWIFAVYGAGKLFGWFGGPGLHRTAEFFASTAHLHPGGFFAVLGGALEFWGAVALALGLLSRPVALALVGDQLIAMATVTWGHGLVGGPRQGYGLNVALVALALVVLALGAGRYSLDAVVGRRLTPAPAAPAPDAAPA
jgi:putative oxidoreductase